VVEEAPEVEEDREESSKRGLEVGEEEEEDDWC
jgi:hypothetical protein